MQTLSINIELPQGKSIDLASIREKVKDYVQHLIMISPNVVAGKESADMADALAFIDSLAVPGGENIPVEDDGKEAVVELKYS